MISIFSKDSLLSETAKAADAARPNSDDTYTSLSGRTNTRTSLSSVATSTLTVLSGSAHSVLYEEDDSDDDFELVPLRTCVPRVHVPPLPAAACRAAIAASKAALETLSECFYRTLVGGCDSETEVEIAKSIRANQVMPYFSGRSGGYFILSCDTREPLAVFKPLQNELGGELDELKDAHLKAKEGIEPGEGAFSEILAYRLQNAMGIDIGIPLTWYSHAACMKFSDTEHVSVRKEGSMQMFVSNCFGADEATPEQISLVSLQQAQMIAAFDIVTANADRTLTNLLLQITSKEELRFVPIDHGCILPREDSSGLTACWISFPQIQAPICQEVRSFIARLNLVPLMSVLAQLQSSGLSLAKETIMKKRTQTHQASIWLLQIAVEKGLYLSEIALFQIDFMPYMNVLSVILFKYKHHTFVSRKSYIQAEINAVITTYLRKKTFLVEGLESTERIKLQQEVLMESARDCSLLKVKI